MRKVVCPLKPKTGLNGAPEAFLIGRKRQGGLKALLQKRTGSAVCRFRFVGSQTVEILEVEAFLMSRKGEGGLKAL
jgi:hypothetical protein